MKDSIYRSTSLLWSMTIKEIISILASSTNKGRQIPLYGERGWGKSTLLEFLSNKGFLCIEGDMMRYLTYAHTMRVDKNMKLEDFRKDPSFSPWKDGSDECDIRFRSELHVQLLQRDCNIDLSCLDYFTEFSGQPASKMALVMNPDYSGYVTALTRRREDMLSDDSAPAEFKKAIFSSHSVMSRDQVEKKLTQYYTYLNSLNMYSIPVPNCYSYNSDDIWNSLLVGRYFER